MGAFLGKSASTNIEYSFFLKYTPSALMIEIRMGEVNNTDTDERVMF